jgi:hypothetical protein
MLLVLNPGFEKLTRFVDSPEARRSLSIVMLDVFMVLPPKEDQDRRGIAPPPYAKGVA